MFCSKCGTENKENAKFCSKCGMPLSCNTDENANNNFSGNKLYDTDVGSGESLTKPKNSKKPLLIAGICMLIIAACIVGVVVYLNGQKDAEYNKKLQTAQQYVEDMDYDKAETAYLDAIDIEPKRDEAYLELSEVYVVREKFEAALEILEDGKENTGHAEAFEKQIEAVRKKSEVNPKNAKNAQYQAYYDLYLEYEEKYGKAAMKVDSFTDVDEIKMLYGVCIVQLIDFNNDGNKELILGYEAGDGEDFQYKYEVWAWHDDKLVQALEPTDANTAQWPMYWLETALYEDFAMIVKDYAAESVEYLYYEDGSFQAEYVVESGMYTGEPKINGEIVSDEEMEELERALPRAANEVGYETGYFDGGFDNLFISFNGIEEKVADSVLDNTEKNIKEIKEAVDIAEDSSADDDGDSDENSNLIGEWEVDVDKTVQSNEMTLSEAFGTSSSYDNSMKINKDSSFLYGFSFLGGGGTWKRDGDKIAYTITSYNSKRKETGTLAIDNGNPSNMYLVMQIDVYSSGYDLYWKKK